MRRPELNVARREAGPRLSDAAEAVAKSLRRASVAPDLVGGLGFLLDAVAVALALWIAAYASEGGEFDPWRAAGFAGAAALALCGVLARLGAYSLRRLRRWLPGLAGIGSMALAAGVAAGLDPVVALLSCLACLAPARLLA